MHIVPLSSSPSPRQADQQQQPSGFPPWLPLRALSCAHQGLSSRCPATDRFWSFRPADRGIRRIDSQKHREARPPVKTSGPGNPPPPSQIARPHDAGHSAPRRLTAVCMASGWGRLEMHITQPYTEAIYVVELGSRCDIGRTPSPSAASSSRLRWSAPSKSPSRSRAESPLPPCDDDPSGRQRASRAWAPNLFMVCEDKPQAWGGEGPDLMSHPSLMSLATVSTRPLWAAAESGEYPMRCPGHEDPFLPTWLMSAPAATAGGHAVRTREGSGGEEVRGGCYRGPRRGGRVPGGRP